MKPKVLWWNSEDARGSWACCNMLNGMLDLYDAEHAPKEWLAGGIVIMHGGNAQLHGRGPATAEVINNFLKPCAWGIFVVIGDEGTEFCSEQFSHPNSRLWVQTPLPTTKADRYLIEGYPAGTKNLGLEKDLDIFFAGQITHDRRRECLAAMWKCDPPSGITRSGQIKPTESFGAGLPHEQYVRLMNRAKVVPCPSGPASPDTFRIWEALECGAIPILDTRSLRPETVGFWDTVLGKHPLPMIEDWSTLPERMTRILADYERIQLLTQVWWRQYRSSFNQWLAEDLNSMGIL